MKLDALGYQMLSVSVISSLKNGLAVSEIKLSTSNAVCYLPRYQVPEDL